ncbi:calcineurin-like phosphoesterase [Apiospora aurea]|uniref:Endopolyphosphatase n=1 Tax=Apiospora aurea TaxID=335848 RepID=A0ABR1PW47_9PEZI
MFQTVSRNWVLSLLVAIELLPAAPVLAVPIEQQAVLKFDAGGSQPQTKPSQRKLHGRFLHITDFHPDLYYQPHTSTEANDACHKGKGPAGVYGAETSDCDSPFALVNATFEWLSKNVQDEVDFVIWTGDSARHDSDESIERTEKEVIKTNRMIADGLAGAFSDSQGLTIPIIPTFGNNDILPHNVMNAGSNKWLRKYLDVWNSFIPEAQRHAFEYGGWFYTEVVPGHLAVFSLNTLYFFDRNAGIDDCVSPSQPGYKQFAWLDAQFSYLRSRGMKAILMGHVPPARTSEKQLWEETCWQKYTLWLQQYRDVIVGATYGHMNIDHFLIQDTHEIDLDLLDNSRGKSKSGKKGKGRKAHKSANSLSNDDDLVSIQSGKDYLVELREAWSKLPKSAVRQTSEVETAKKKGKKHKKKKGKKNSDIGGPWAERFQLSLISPSVVPNYYPTYRIYEYNITGLEDAPTWSDVRRGSSSEEENGSMSEFRAAIQQPLAEKDETDSTAAAKKRKKESKEENNENSATLVIPEGPSKTTAPGPAYSPQTLSFTGFTQYFANLTHINNDMASEDVNDDRISPRGWNEGKHRGKKPSHKPKPRAFNYEVEYSTFQDDLYELHDMTVRSFVELAYRIGQAPAGSTASAQELRADGDSDKENNDVDDEDEDDEDDEELNAEKKNKKKHKGKKKKHKKKKKLTELWLHFLEHAFVKTKTRDEIKEDL